MRKRRSRRALKKTRRAEPKHRKPPLPDHFLTASSGQCRWCGKAVLDNSGNINFRRRWHKECLHPYFMLTRQSYAKREVKKRDKGVCAKCGTKCRYRHEWDLDHRIPLIDSNGDAWFWSMENLQTLCKKCHTEKTVAENRARQEKRGGK